jgi:hypothetical protein
MNSRNEVVDVCVGCDFSNGEDCAFHFAPTELLREGLNNGSVVKCNGKLI